MPLTFLEEKDLANLQRSAEETDRITDWLCLLAAQQTAMLKRMGELVEEVRRLRGEWTHGDQRESR